MRCFLALSCCQCIRNIGDCFRALALSERLRVKSFLRLLTCYIYTVMRNLSVLSVVIISIFIKLVDCIAWYSPRELLFLTKYNFVMMLVCLSERMHCYFPTDIRQSSYSTYRVQNFVRIIINLVLFSGQFKLKIGSKPFLEFSFIRKIPFDF